jgi:Na+/proline symporter
MNQVIELPVWFILIAAVGCYILGMIAELAAQTKSLKQQQKERKKERAVLLVAVAGVIFFFWMVVRPLFRKKDKIDPPADGPSSLIDQFTDTMK